jgi:hypothetical protein
MTNVRVLQSKGPGPRAPLFREASGRFGEWFEAAGPLLHRNEPLVREATRRDLDPSIVLTLLVERELLLVDLAAAGVAVANAMAELRAAASSIPLQGPGTPHGSYVRQLMLSCRRPAHPRTGEAPRDIQAAVPARLLARVKGNVCDRAISAAATAVALDDAILWEVAAASAGRTMAEWALLVLLREERS